MSSENRPAKTNVDSLQGFILVAGIYEGALPFLSRVFDWHPFLAFPTRLDAPWWWLVSAVALVVAVVLILVLERVKDPAP
ncbi:hypothetical protein [Jatrophihabitans fulvus]